MGYTVKGNFSAALFPDVGEAVSDARVRIYRVVDDNSKVERPGKRKSFRVLTDKEITDKEHLLVGKGSTDKDGNYEIDLSDNYQDASIAIDVKVTSLPGQKRAKHEPVQFSVRSLKPVWRVEKEGLYYCFNYCFPFEFWCQIRTILDVWTICGHVKSAEHDQAPVTGVTVSAFDVDWIKDDILGNSMTDKNGFFRIDFESTDFKQTFLSPLINIETPISSIPGPGVYFKVTDSDGNLLYEEKRAEGRTDERKHIPRCYYTDLYLVGVNNGILNAD